MMKTFMRGATSVLLVAAMLLGMTACGAGDPGSASNAASSSQSEPEPIRQAFLTGLEQGANYPEGKRFVAVMVNNIGTARPQRGISEAEILIEIKVEGGITRLCALFPDYAEIPTVGPIRSARDQFFQLFMPFWPFFIHDGASVVQQQYVSDWDYQEFDLDTGLYADLSYRNTERLNSAGQYVDWEHTEYTDGDMIANVISENNLDDARSYGSPIFSFVPYNEPKRELDGGEALSVPVIHSQSYRTLLQYDAASGRYAMSMYNPNVGVVETTIDENNGQQLSFDNALILFTDIHTYYGHEEKNLQEVMYGDGGVGYYFCNGRYEKIRWQKGGPQDPLRLVSFDGTETTVSLNPGNTYIAVVDNDNLEGFHDSIELNNGAEQVASGSSIESQIEIGED